ncbi:MAG: DUF1707 domain-containing protein [Thermoleophilaceae bacterium]
MSSRAKLRASDADRDAVTDRLRTAAAEGRLETEELDQRLEVALRARTYGELDGLVSDLPSSHPVPWGRPRARVVPAAQAAFAVALPILTTLAVVAAIVVVATVAAAWWVMWGLVWFFMCGRGGRSMGRRTSARAVQRTRPAGLH